MIVIVVIIINVIVVVAINIIGAVVAGVRAGVAGPGHHPHQQEERQVNPLQQKEEGLSW